jgi:hypothetical protein
MRTNKQVLVLLLATSAILTQSKFSMIDGESELWFKGQ